MLTASPWDALLKLREPITLQSFSAPHLHQHQPLESGTKLALVLNAIGADHRTTLSLAISCDLTTNQVWGLLKAPRADGQVNFDGERWSQVLAYPGRDVMRAARLLRSKGWIVEPPKDS